MFGFSTGLLRETCPATAIAVALSDSRTQRTGRILIDFRDKLGSGLPETGRLRATGHIPRLREVESAFGTLVIEIPRNAVVNPTAVAENEATQFS